MASTNDLTSELNKAKSRRLDGIGSEAAELPAAPTTDSESFTSATRLATARPLSPSGGPRGIERRETQTGSYLRSSVIDSEDADVALQRGLSQLSRATDDADARAIVRELLSVAAGRILLLCGSMLSRHYPRLAKGPLNVQPDELLGAVAERLIKAMRNVRPSHVREFFALAMKHIRWELNGLARELDADRYERLAPDAIAQEPEAIVAQFSPQARRILEAIYVLPQIDREIFNLVRLRGMTQAAAAELLGISMKTVQRRLKRILPQLWGQLGEPQPAQGVDPHTDTTLRPRFVGAEGTTGEQPSKQVA